MRGGLRPTSRAISRENLPQRHVLAAEDVALARAAALERQQMSGGDVIHVHDVESRIDVGGHAAGCGVQNHLPGRRGLDVARPHRRRRIDDDHGQSPSGPPRAPLLRRETSSACSGRSCCRDATGVPPRPASRPPESRWSQRCWCRRFAAPRPCGQHSEMLRVPSTLVRYRVLRIARAQSIVRRNVKQAVATLERALAATPGRARSPSTTSTAKRLQDCRGPNLPAPGRAPASRRRREPGQRRRRRNRWRR